MKPISILASVFLAVSLAGCVSSKKYKAAVDSSQRNEQALNACEKERLTLQSDLAQSKEALRTTQQQLDSKDKLLKDDAKRLHDLNDLVSEQRNAIQNLKKEVCDALKCFSPDELSIEVRDGKLYVSLSDKLLFPSGSDVVNERGKEAISMLSAVLANSSLEVMVEGHTDNVPIRTERNRDNWDLSVHRATSVARLMIDNGIDRQRIITSGRGEFHPVAENSSVEGRQHNRRTEIVLAPRLDKLWKLTEQEETVSTK
jgi:chemotaxis protein MotB